MANTNQQYIDEANALLTTAAAKIASESTLEDSIIALVTTLQGANTALAARVDQIIADTTIDPASVTAIRAAFQANSDALDANVAKLTAAVPAGTPAAPTP